MLTKIIKFIRNYYLFAVAAVALIAALILQFTRLSKWGHLLLSVVALAETLPLVWGMWQDLREGTYGIDVLAATAIITSVIMKQYWAAIVIVIMLTGGEALEDFAEHRAKTELNALLEKAPTQAHIVRGGKVLDVPIAQVKVGDKLIVKPGEIVPVDAVVLEGAGDFDESSLTGESLPQSKKASDNLLSGSLSVDGALTVKALHEAADSQYQQIIKLVKSAAASRAPFVRLADRYSVPFTVISFAIAFGAWTVSGQSIRFLEVLVVATPCPLILAAPIAVISGMSRAAKQGIIVKTGGALERLAEAQTIAFDKTGTLTRGSLKVDKIESYGKFKQADVLAAAAALEQNSNHILAKAITVAAIKKKLKIGKAKNIKEISGMGLMAAVAGKRIVIGRAEFLAEQEIKITGAGSKSTSTYVAINGELAGIISFSDEVRPESKNTIKALKAFGIKKILLVTGDRHAVAAAIAKSLGISEVHAETLPADKLRIIEHLKERPVVFVGDGVNDAPVLTAADIGIAIGARGESAASESADMVIMLNDIGRVARAFSIARRTFSVAKQSILTGIALSIILMLIFSTGHFKPLYGAIIQEAVDIVVIFNALRAHSAGRKAE